MKPCRKCGSTERYPSGGCKPCGVNANRERRKVRPVESKAARDVWRKKNASRIYELNRAWMGTRGLLPSQKSASYRTYHKKPKDGTCAHCGASERYPSGGCKPCRIATNKAYRAKNADKVKGNQRLYLAANADKVRRMRQNRRARLADAGVLSEGICEALYAAQGGRCACCGESLGINYDLDHIMPLALNGLNVDANMQLLTARCNGRKLAKHPEQYAKERDFCYWPRRDWTQLTRRQ